MRLNQRYSMHCVHLWWTMVFAETHLIWPCDPWNIRCFSWCSYFAILGNSLHHPRWGRGWIYQFFGRYEVSVTLPHDANDIASCESSSWVVTKTIHQKVWRWAGQDIFWQSSRLHIYFCFYGFYAGFDGPCLYSYGHLPVISGYKWDYTFYKWGFVSTYNW